MDKTSSSHRRRTDRPRLGDGVRARRVARAPVPTAMPAQLARARDIHRGEPRRAAGDTGSSPTPRAALARIEYAADIESAIAGADWVQENLPEEVEVKREVFARSIATRRPDAVLASSTSAIPASRFTESAGRARALPGRASGQSAASGADRRAVRRAVDRAGDDRARASGYYATVGQVPIVVRRELDGFILNRLQGALLSEAMRLVGEGYVSAEDLDKTVRDGLGLALVVHGAVRDDRAQRARRRGRLLRALRRLLSPACRRPGRRRRCGTPTMRRKVARRARRAALARGRARSANALARSPPDGAGRAQARTTGFRIRRSAMAARQSRKVIITCAVTGSIHTPSMSPLSAGHAAGDRRRGGRRGRSRRGDRPSARARSGRRTSDAGSEVLPRLRRRHRAAQRRRDQFHDRRRGDDDHRGAPAAGAAAQARGRVAQHGLDELRALPDAEALHRRSSTTGSAPYLAASDERIFKNTFKDIEYILTSCADNGTRFEIECYDIGHLYTAAHFFDRGIVKPPLFIQSVFGILGGIGAHPDDVAHMKRTADRLFGDQYRWSVLGAGRNQLPIAAMSAAMGGNVRVGLEDSLWLGAGQARRIECRAGARRARRSSKRWDSRSRRPTRRGEILKLKGRRRGRVLKRGRTPEAPRADQKKRGPACAGNRAAGAKKSAHQAATLIAASAAAAPGAAARKLATSSASFAFATFRWRSLTWPYPRMCSGIEASSTAIA